MQNNHDVPLKLTNQKSDPLPDRFELLNCHLSLAPRMTRAPIEASNLIG